MSILKYNTQTPDRKIDFDFSVDYLAFVPGEKAQYTTRNVVDVKQTNNYSETSKQGTMVVTNLRCIYYLD